MWIIFSKFYAKHKSLPFLISKISKKLERISYQTPSIYFHNFFFLAKVREINFRGYNFSIVFIIYASNIVFFLSRDWIIIFPPWASFFYQCNWSNISHFAGKSATPACMPKGIPCTHQDKMRRHCIKVVVMKRKSTLSR